MNLFSVIEKIEKSIMKEENQIMLKATWLFIKLSFLVLLAFLFTKSVFLSIFAVIIILGIIYFTVFFLVDLFNDLKFFFYLFIAKQVNKWNNK